MRDFVSKTARDLKPSGIRKFFDLCAGSPDIISLGVGEPDFVTPWQISSGGITAIKQGRTTYTGNAGLPELKKEIAEYLKRFNLDYKPEEVMVTIGASEAIDVSLRAVIDPGDEVLVPDPSYVSYAPCIELCGGVPVPVKCVSDNGFIITAEELEKVKAVLSDNATNLFETSVSCIGSATCQVGLRDSQSLLTKCINAVKEANINSLPQIHISGCPSSCGTHQIGKLGFRGHTKVVDKVPQVAFMFYAGGDDRQGNETMGKEVGVMLENDIPVFLTELGKAVEESGLSFDEWYTIEKVEEIAKKYL